MAEKQTNKDRMREIVDSIENGIKELFESDKYQQYLSTMSRFHRYSVNNTMLIYMQRPDATHVAGFNKWRDQFGRNVLKGEKGIRIIAPTPYKKKVEEIKTDPETNAPILDADGKAIIEEKEIRIPMFKVVSVFDVSQTAGKPLPQLAADLSGNVQQYEVFMEALRRASPVPMEIKPVARDTDGFFSIKAQSITIRAGMSEVQTVCAAVHEIAHAKLHDYEHMTELADDGETILVPGEKSRNTEEVEAESISYAVCQYYGIETGENSFGYIATWSKGKELKELRASLETINKTASELIMAAIRLLQELEFEGIQASPEQQEILSRYVGWGGLADAFAENKPNWSDEFAELYATLSPEEYAAARASTLNAHYTSPTVIKAIYEAVGNMGFQSGNILEPSMGVGNFFGLLPEQMQGSKLYGVELDSITGRIAKQLYPTHIPCP